MNAAIAVLLAGLAAAPSQEELQARARETLRRSQQNEISTSEARREVHLLLKDLKKWAESEGIELSLRSRLFSSPSTGPGEVLTVDRCAIFFEEDLTHLCPLDFSRSEVWGATVLFCRYLCVPSPP